MPKQVLQDAQSGIPSTELSYGHRMEIFELKIIT